MRALVLATALAAIAVTNAYRPGFRASGHNFLLKYATGDVAGPEEKWFPQVVDHYDYQDIRTWQQRYFINDEYYNSSKPGPVFFVLGGEGSISNRYVTSLKIVDYAKEHGGLMVALEHRFYGKSQPTGDLSLDSLRTLNSRQALADAAYFIKSILDDDKFRGHGPIIAFGGSYPGALAAWFRQTYPHIIKGAIASSGPVLAVLDMTSYLTSVSETLSKFYDGKCLDAYRNAFAVANRYARNPNTVGNLQKLFNTCTPVPPVVGDEIPRDTAIFFENLNEMTMGVVQYHLESPSNPTVKDLCDVILDESISAFPIDRLAAMWKKYGTEGKPCMDISYGNTIAELRNATVDPRGGVGMRQWVYQTCTEFGYFQTTDAPASQQPFGDLVPLQLSLDICEDSYTAGALGLAPKTSTLTASRAPRRVEAVDKPDGKRVRRVGLMGPNPDPPVSPLSPRIEETNILFGGLNPIGASNILHVNGDVDPWHTLSILKDLTPTIRSLMIKDAAHCADMSRIIEGLTPPDMKRAHDIIRKTVTEWINAPDA